MEFCLWQNSRSKSAPRAAPASLPEGLGAGSLLRLQVFASLFTYGEFAAKTPIYGLP
jgi:hypothetical protein